MATGVYVLYRNVATGQECARVGPSAVCFCGHSLGAHRGPDGGKCGGGPKFTFLTEPASSEAARAAPGRLAPASSDRRKGHSGRSAALERPAPVSGSDDEICKPSSSSSSLSSSPCACRRFAFVPRRPEEVGEWWLPRRRGFDVHAWRAKCRCGHSHDEHHPLSRRCAATGCGAFSSAFRCVVCEAPWEAHETVAEGEEERRAAGKPVRDHFFPFADAPDLRPLVFGGDGANGGTGARPLQSSRGGLLGGTGGDSRCTRRLGCPCFACSASAVAVAEEEEATGAPRGGGGLGGSSSVQRGLRLRPDNPTHRPERSVLLMHNRAGGRRAVAGGREPVAGGRRAVAGGRGSGGRGRGRELGES